ncbi:hypothetical protein ACBY01_10355 [Sphingomonas sp. ac-8]|uniref:hypothetical protein n=1 Tax=Sphingomonas sp. ac-8 TaxID=3242977 RepID=UPI003A80EC2C
MTGLLALALVPAALFGAMPLPDIKLAEQRGGFRLPNGVDVAMTVQTQTALDGAVVLRSVFRLDSGQPSFVVYTPREGETIASPSAGSRDATDASARTQVRYDSRGGIQITPGVAAPQLSVGGAGVPADADDRFVTLPDGASVASGAGSVHQSSQGPLQTAEWRGADLSITHLAGSAFGAAVVNTGNDRAIDTETSLFLSLDNAGPDVVGSSMLRAGELAFDAAQLRVR